MKHNEEIRVQGDVINITENDHPLLYEITGEAVVWSKWSPNEISDDILSALRTFFRMHLSNNETVEGLIVDGDQARIFIGGNVRPMMRDRETIAEQRIVDAANEQVYRVLEKQRELEELKLNLKALLPEILPEILKEIETKGD